MRDRSGKSRQRIFRPERRAAPVRDIERFPHVSF
jgi:hypothetical protein